MPVVNGLAVSLDYGTMRACGCGCGREFRVNSITGNHWYATTQCKERALWRSESRRPDIVEKNRARCREWAQQHRGVKRSQPWLLGAPPFSPELPGVALEFDVRPRPRWPIVHRNIRALHGMMTSLTGQHHPHLPVFSLAPWKRGIEWIVYVQDAERVNDLLGSSVEAVLFGSNVTVRFGNRYRLRSPVVSKRGRRRLRIDAITPVCLKRKSSVSGAGSSGDYVLPTSDNLTSTLESFTAARLSGAGRGTVKLELVKREAFQMCVPIGGKLGNVSGWGGSVFVDANAPGEWLLRVAAMIGLGGASAYGFGSIRVSHAAQ